MTFDLAIVGAGPAGLAAAEVAADLGLRVAVIDEQPRPGGQIYRQPPAEFRVGDWLAGRAYRKGRDLVARVAGRQDIVWLTGAIASGVFRTGDGDGFAVILERDGSVEEHEAARLLVAPGCYDMPVIFPGWNLPGVMAAGGIQAFVKSQRLIPGERFVFAGTHPLQLVVADQLAAAGAEVAGVYFAQPSSAGLAPLRRPGVALRGAGKLFQAAGALARLRRAGVPVAFGRTVIEARGDGRLKSVRVARVEAGGRVGDASPQVVECDRLGVCFGFLTSSELVRSLGAPCDWVPQRGGWVAVHDDWMRSGVPGLCVAGEITGVEGADVAAAEGALAALGCALDHGALSAEQARRRADACRRRLKPLRAFAGLLAELAWPGANLLDQLTSPGANLCKCEEVTVQSFVRMLDEHPHVRTASAAKLLSRAGMGYCQGRYCHASLTRVLAAHRGMPESSVGGFTARFPNRPLSIDVLLGTKETD